MRLLIAADIFPPESGGPATYAVTLANELTKQGIEVKIVSLNPQSDQSVVSCSVYRVSWKNKLLRYLQYLWLLLKHASSADVIYAMGPVNAGLPAWLAARLRGKKFVVKVVGDYAWEQGVQRFSVTDSIDVFQKFFSKYPLCVRLLKWVENLVVRHADHVIVPCLYLKELVVGWGMTNTKIQVIYNAVEFKEVELLPKPVGEKWIVSVARLLPWKGMNALIEIMPEIIKAVPEAKLKIVGDGSEFENLKSKIAQLKLENATELTGGLSHDKALAYIKSSDVFLLNSAYEGLSHVILEAYSFGKPVLASDCGGNSEVVIQGFPGALFKFNDSNDMAKKIIEYIKIFSHNLASPEQLRSAMQKEHSLSIMINKTIEVLQNLCNP